MTDDKPLPFLLPAVRRKKVIAAFDGGRLSSDGGVMLLAAAARRPGIAARLAAVIPDARDPTRVVHPLAEILLARILAIACGYADADDLDACAPTRRSSWPAAACPRAGSTCARSRPSRAGRTRPACAICSGSAGSWSTSTAPAMRQPPTAVVLDIDDTVDVVHGRQQLSLFNAHYDERCFLPIHVYDTATARPVAVILRPGKTPSGREVRGHLRRLVRRSAAIGPRPGSPSAATAITAGPRSWTAARPTGSTTSSASPARPRSRPRSRRRADAVRVERALEDQDAVRGFAETTLRRQVLEQASAASPPASRPRAMGLDIRYVVTNIATGTAEWLYAGLYCARGQAENLIKLHKAQLASDRTSCRAPPPTRCGWSCTPPPTGWCSPSATRSPGRTRSPGPSSPPSGCGCSRSPPASPRAPAGCASPSPPPVPMPACSANSRANSDLRRRLSRGAACPAEPVPATSNAHPDPITPSAQTAPRRSRVSADHGRPSAAHG